jgi:hypothetical protein
MRRASVYERGSPSSGSGVTSPLEGWSGTSDSTSCPAGPIQWDRAITVSFGEGAAIRVVDLESLIRLKLKAGGPKDLMDVAALVLLHPEHEERAQELAVAYRIRDKLDIWLRDPRLKAELADAGSEETERRPHAESPLPLTPGRARKKVDRNRK